MLGFHQYRAQASDDVRIGFDLRRVMPYEIHREFDQGEVQLLLCGLVEDISCAL